VHKVPPKPKNDENYRCVIAPLESIKIIDRKPPASFDKIKVRALPGLEVPGKPSAASPEICLFLEGSHPEKYYDHGGFRF
jgi:hypothetical protein